jgi:hypothetical protein
LGAKEAATFETGRSLVAKGAAGNVQRTVVENPTAVEAVRGIVAEFAPREAQRAIVVDAAAAAGAVAVEGTSTRMSGDYVVARKALLQATSDMEQYCQSIVKTDTASPDTDAFRFARAEVTLAEQLVPPPY